MLVSGFDIRISDSLSRYQPNLSIRQHQRPLTIAMAMEYLLQRGQQALVLLRRTDRDAQFVVESGGVEIAHVDVPLG